MFFFNLSNLSSGGRSEYCLMTNRFQAPKIEKYQIPEGI